MSHQTPEPTRTHADARDGASGLVRASEDNDDAPLFTGFPGAQAGRKRLVRRMADPFVEHRQRYRVRARRAAAMDAD